MPQSSAACAISRASSRVFPAMRMTPIAMRLASTPLDPIPWYFMMPLS